MLPLLAAAALAALALAARAPAEPDAVEARAATAPEPPRSVELRVLTYNTHGLPSWVAGDDPQRRFPRIGALARSYDVALLQEDFYHHGALVAASGAGTLIRRGNESRFQGTPLCLLTCQGSGLTLLSRLPSRWLLELESRAYRACSGWRSAGNDCFASKGFQRALFLLGGDLEVQFVNTHLDAGGAGEDRAARREQLEILREHLDREAADAALVLGGDLNLSAGDPEDAALRDAFARALGLRDTGAAPAPGSAWEHLDYLFVRDGSAVLLEVLEAGEAREFSEGGAPLSDHPALFVRLRARPIF